MLMRKIGNTDILVSAVAMGTSPIAGGEWWGAVDDEESIRTIRAAFDSGINFFDTAPSYGFGHAEEVLGRALSALPRDSFVVTTKCGQVWDTDEGEELIFRDGKTIRKNLSEKMMEADINASLKRLGLETIDLYLLHTLPKEGTPGYRPPEEVADTLKRFIRQGKIRAAGISNVSTRIVKEYQKHMEISLVQNKYSILDRRSEAELIPHCEKSGVTFQCYSPLEKGMLTSRRDYGADVADQTKTRTTVPWFLPENRKIVYDMLDLWQDLCEKYGCDVSNLAAAWIIAQGSRINALCGARRESQIRMNAKSGEIMLQNIDVLRMRESADRALEKLRKKEKN